MTATEAIQVLQSILTFVEPGDPPEEHQALQLGIEALQRFNALRFASLLPGLPWLPSETSRLTWLH